MELGQLKNPRVSLEAIEPQGKSELAQGLIDIFSDAKTKYFEDLQKTAQKPQIALKNYFKKQLQPKFEKIITENTGLKIEYVRVFDKPRLGAAIMPLLGNKLSTVDAVSRYTGFGQMPERLEKITGQEILSYDDFRKISNSLNRETGYVDESVVKEMDLKIIPAIDIFFIVSMKDFVHPDAEDLTAEEGAAIWLHEIGHMISLIEKCADQYFKFEAHRQVTQSFVDNASYGEQMKALQDVVDSQILTNTAKGRIKQEAASKLINNYASLMGDGTADEIREKKKPGETTKDAGRKGIGLVASLLVVILHFLIVSFVTFKNTAMTSLTRLFSVFDVEGLGWNAKYSDIAFTPETHVPEKERRADEYVSMHGMGGQLGSSMRKATEVAEQYGDEKLKAKFPVPSIAGQLQKSEMYAQVIHFYSYLVGISMRVDDRYQEHEGLVDRLISLQQDASRVLREESNLSDEQIRLYIKEFDRCRENIEQRLDSRDKKSIRFVDSMFKILEAVTDGYSLFDLVMDARFRKTYKEVADAVQNIQASPLFQKAAKLRMQEEGRM